MIYLDNNATSFPEEKIFPFLEQLFGEGLGNPSSVHRLGQRAKQLVNDTTQLICESLSFPGRVLYTSGATEALNCIIANLPTHSHVITSSMEHAAILEPLKRAPLHVSYLDPDVHSGTVTVDQVEKALTPQTSAILLGWVNSEIGTRIDLEAIAHMACQHHVLLFVDATAIVGKEPIKVPTGVSGIVFSGHKFHALSGIGCLILAPKISIKPIIFGGGQQAGLRSGTENICGIASLNYMFQKFKNEQLDLSQKILSLRDRFESRISELLPDAIIHYRYQNRVNNISAIAFPPLEGEVLQIALDMEGVACGFGSACSSGATVAFKSLASLGVDPMIAAATLRFSFSYMLSETDVEQAVEILFRTITRFKEQF